jgi:hypothetical protein
MKYIVLLLTFSLSTSFAGRASILYEKSDKIGNSLKQLRVCHQGKTAQCGLFVVANEHHHTDEEVREAVNLYKQLVQNVEWPYEEDVAMLAEFENTDCPFTILPSENFIGVDSNTEGIIGEKSVPLSEVKIHLHDMKDKGIPYEHCFYMGTMLSEDPESLKKHGKIIQKSNRGHWYSIRLLQDATGKREYIVKDSLNEKSIDRKGVLKLSEFLGNKFLPSKDKQLQQDSALSQENIPSPTNPPSIDKPPLSVSHLSFFPGLNTPLIYVPLFIASSAFIAHKVRSAYHEHTKEIAMPDQYNSNNIDDLSAKEATLLDKCIL